jgi:Putative Ig domain
VVTVTNPGAQTGTAGTAIGTLDIAATSNDGNQITSYGATDLPAGLTLDTTTGMVSGTVPAGITSFSYSVTATNMAGTATAGPYTVMVTAASVKADLAARLSCPASLKVAGTGTPGQPG